jgi:hypothetical protein
MSVEEARPALDKAALEYFSAQVATDERWRELESVYLAAREALIARAREEGAREALARAATEIDGLRAKWESEMDECRTPEGRNVFAAHVHAFRMAVSCVRPAERQP